MIPIKFNAAALLQALVLAPILGILYLFSIEELFKQLNVPDWAAIAILSYLCFFIVAKMEHKGINGYVVYMPTWLVILCVPPVTTLLAENTYRVWLLFAVSTFFTLWFLAKKDLVFRDNFMNCWREGQYLKYMKDHTHNSEDFWKLAEKCIIDPGFVFLYMNPLYSGIFKGTVTLSEFTTHYREILPAVIENTTKKKDVKRLREFEKALQQREYCHEMNSISNLSRIIEARNGKLI